MRRIRLRAGVDREFHGASGRGRREPDRLVQLAERHCDGGAHSAQFANLSESGGPSPSTYDYYVYNASASFDVHLLPGSYVLAFYYPGASVDTVTATDPIEFGNGAPESQSASGAATGASSSSGAAASSKGPAIPPPNPTAAGPSPSKSSGAQVWKLSFDSGAITTDDPGAVDWYSFDSGISTVVVQPFTNSGPFDLTGTSGWVISAPDGNTYPLNIGGNIFHNSPGDTWDFTGFGTVAGSNAQCLGSATGKANGNFPGATSVSGTYNMNCNEVDSLGGAVTWSLTGTWSGKRS